MTANGAGRGERSVGAVADRDDWPVHQPGPAWEAPIPGIHWYGGCEPGYPRVNPATGVCEGCGEEACPSCGRQGCESGPEEAFRCPGVLVGGEAA